MTSKSAVLEPDVALGRGVETRNGILSRFHVSRASPVPIYHQIKEQILDAVASGVLAEGDPLPSERELVEHLNVSRMTIRRALNDLVTSGQLHTRPGKGTYVRTAKVQQLLARLAGFSADMSRAGHKVTSRVIRFEIVTAEGKMTELLQIDRGDLVVVLERVRLVDGEPTSWERSNLPARLCPNITRFDFGRESLYDVLRRQYKIALRWARQTMEATLANWHEHELLLIPEGAPILLSERTVYTDDNAVIEYGKSSFRGDRYKYDVQLIGDQSDELT
jgi:GntR family transcriptional regulator